MQRTVKGEVIHSTFDRPADDHTTVAELAIERAKRLVEMGHDVVVLLDSITRLGRAYNLAAPASGRILSGGCRLGRALPAEAVLRRRAQHRERRLADDPATALIETGSRLERGHLRGVQGHRQHGTAAAPRPGRQADLPGDRRRCVRHPQGRAADVPEELKIIWQLRRVLHALEAQQALEVLMDRMKDTKSNAEFLLKVQKTTVGS